jgi:O-antigen ligase
MMSLTNLDQDYNNTEPTGRKAVWERGRGYIRQNPLVGVGVGNFPIAEGQTLDEAQQHGKWSTAHNAYIQAYAELGLPGGTILVVLLVSGAIIGVRYARGVRFGDETVTRPEYIASVASYAVSGIFLSHAYFSPMFALLGLLALADRVAEVESATAPVDGTVIAPQPIRIGQRGGLARGSPWPAAR